MTDNVIVAQASETTDGSVSGPEISRGAQVRAYVVENANLAGLRKLILAFTLAFSILATGYWLLIASDRYVSEAHVLVQKTDLPGTSATDFGSLLSGIGNNGNRPDQLLLRDHLLSIDMLRKLDAELHLRDHYSNWHRDPLSRMWSRDTSIEKFHDYYLSRVRVDYDDYAGVLVIRSQAFDPKTAQAITAALIREGEAFMNRNDHQLARAQVDFLEDEVAAMSVRNAEARRAVVEFQNREGMVSPEATLQSIAGIVAQLEARKSVLETQVRSLESYLVPNHPSVVGARQELDSVTTQLDKERKRLASTSGAPLNRTAEKFQRLQMQAAFTQQLYQTTLAALEKGRIDAMRTVKKVSVMQNASMPEYSTEPQRLYNSVLYTLVSFLLAGVALLLIAIVRDHID